MVGRDWLVSRAFHPHKFTLSPYKKHHSFGPSHLPQHLDGVDNSNVGVVEVVEGAKGEGREGPDQGLGQIGDDSRPSEERGPDVVDHDGLNAPVAVKD